MLFKYLEAQIMDYFTSITPKTVLRQAKRVMRQINSSIDGKLNTVAAVEEVTNSTMTFTATPVGGDKIIDADGNSYFADASSGDKILINGSDSNDGIFTIANVVDDDTVEVDETAVQELATSGVTVIVMTVDSNYTISYNDAYSVVELTLPSTFNQLSPQGVIVGDDSWDEWSYDYILNNTTKEAYALEGRNTIAFAVNAWKSDVNTVIKGYFGLTIVTSSAAATDIDIPAAWEECLIAGVLSHIAALSDYKDEDIYKTQTKLYQESISYIVRQEMNKYSVTQQELNYNYANPSESS